MSCFRLNLAGFSSYRTRLFQNNSAPPCRTPQQAPLFTSIALLFQHHRTAVPAGGAPFSLDTLLTGSGGAGGAATGGGATGGGAGGAGIGLSDGDGYTDAALNATGLGLWGWCFPSPTPMVGATGGVQIPGAGPGAGAGAGAGPGAGGTILAGVPGFGGIGNFQTVAATVAAASTATPGCGGLQEVGPGGLGSDRYSGPMALGQQHLEPGDRGSSGAFGGGGNGGGTTSSSGSSSTGGAAGVGAAAAAHECGGGHGGGGGGQEQEGSGQSEGDRDREGYSTSSELKRQERNAREQRR